MIAALAVLLLLAAPAESEVVPAPAKETKVAQVTPATLPPVASTPRYGAPPSLPPVTAQLFHLGGMLEVEPLAPVSVSVKILVTPFIFIL